MSEPQDRTCSDCDGNLQPIVVMDVGHQGHIGQLMDRSFDDKRSFWTGRFPTGGPVQAFLCQDCGLIALFGQPTAPVAEEPDIADEE
jgi:hypothetical protein